MMLIDEQRLDLVGEIGEIAAVTVSHVRSSDPQLPGDLAFKRPGPGLGADVQRRLLESMQDAVRARELIAAPDLAELDRHTTWPLAMVARDGRVVGCLSQLIPFDYYLQTRAPDGQRRYRPFEWRLLSASADQLGSVADVRAATDDELVLLTLMARLAYAVEVLHRPHSYLRLVYGDLNPRTIVVATSPPRILLTGAEGVADVNDITRNQANSPFFLPPEIGDGQQKLQDQLTDVYKLGLCIMRGLAVGRGASQLTDPASPQVRPGLLDAAGVNLLRAAVGPDRDHRPTAEEIKDYLIGRVLDLAERRV